MSRARKSFLLGSRAILPLVPAAFAFGLVTGTATGEAGLGLAETVGMSVFVYSGVAHLATTVLWGEGAPLLVVIGTGLVLNARLFIYSASIAPVFSEAKPLERSVLGYLLRDVAYALTMARRHRSDIAIVPYYIGVAFTDWAIWLVAMVVGFLGAQTVPGGWSLDFIIPLVFIAFLMDALKDRIDVETALVTAVAAAVLVPLLPLETGLLAAIGVGAAWGFIRDTEDTGPKEAAA